MGSRRRQEAANSTIRKTAERAHRAAGHRAVRQAARNTGPRRTDLVLEVTPMPKSMTGYGVGTTATEEFVLTVELKSVNHRFLKLNGRVSEEFSFLQIELEDLIRKTVHRGAIYYSAMVEPTCRADLYDIDLGILEKYLTTLQKHEGRLSLATAEPPQPKDLLLLPGVVRAEETLKLRRSGLDHQGISREELVTATRTAGKQALDELLAMRSQEGGFLAGEFAVRCQILHDLLGQVKQATPQAIKDHNQRLLDRINHLLSESSLQAHPDDLIREVAIIAERADVAEELTRMESHLQQFLETIEQPPPVGRKLEFIVQEMFRESNTMGAKVSDVSLGRTIVEIKAEVDRLKEQVLNIE